MVFDFCVLDTSTQHAMTRNMINTINAYYCLNVRSWEIWILNVTCTIIKEQKTTTKL